MLCFERSDRLYVSGSGAHTTEQGGRSGEKTFDEFSRSSIRQETKRESEVASNLRERECVRRITSKAL